MIASEGEQSRILEIGGRRFLSEEGRFWLAVVKTAGVPRRILRALITMLDDAMSTGGMTVALDPSLSLGLVLHQCHPKSLRPMRTTVLLLRLRR